MSGSDTRSVEVSLSYGPVPDAASRFFDNCLDCLEKAVDHQMQKRWGVRRLEGFINAQNGYKFKSLSGSFIDAYLDVIGRLNRLSDRKIRQCIDAIRIPYRYLLSPEVADSLGWLFGLDSATALEQQSNTASTFCCAT